MTHASHRVLASDQPITVSLPCTPEHFAEFITGLLGRPQTIRRRIYMLFDIGKDDMVSLHHLVVQRIEQQNDAQLVQFVVSITFDDQSSIRLTSLSDFEKYNEVRPLKSVAVLLNWVFLINFRDRRYPEKQEISVHFMVPEKHSNPSGPPYPFDEEDLPFVYSAMRGSKVAGVVHVEIKYTARTWGNDVDNLLNGQIKSIEKTDNAIARFANHHGGKMLVFMLVAIVVLGFVSLFTYATRVDSAERSAAVQVLDGDLPFEDKMIEAVRMMNLAGEDYGPAVVAVGGCIVIFILAGTLTAMTDHTMASLARRSRVRLTRLSENTAAEEEVTFRRRIAAFVGVQLLNAGVGVLMILLGSYLVPAG